jgi:hypothetical protein
MLEISSPFPFYPCLLDSVLSLGFRWTSFSHLTLWNPLCLPLPSSLLFSNPYITMAQTHHHAGKRQKLAPRWRDEELPRFLRRDTDSSPEATRLPPTPPLPPDHSSPEAARLPPTPLLPPDHPRVHTSISTVKL